MKILWAALMRPQFCRFSARVDRFILSASGLRRAGAVLAVAAMAGCGSGVLATPGSGTGPAPATGVAPTIVTQPTSATIPLDSSATLSVVATGTGPLSYQWTQNGNAVSGATSASLTTAALQLADSGDTFSVTVSNAYGSVASDVATVTIGPRSPRPRDMRFKHVQLTANLQPGLKTNIVAFIPGDMLLAQYTDQMGTPLSVGNMSCDEHGNPVICAWDLLDYGPPAGMPGFSSAYQSDTLTNLDGDLTGLPSNAIVTSMDEQSGPAFAYGIFGYSVETDPTVTGGFALKRAQVTDATVAATVSAMAASGVVVTAVSANSAGGIDLVGYSWSGDAGTIYDAETVLTSYKTVGPQAASLAQQGYIITAVGTADANQVLLVGTKVHGDTLPRALAYSGYASGGTSSSGSVVVGQTFGNDAGDSPGLPSYQFVLTQ